MMIKGIKVKDLITALNGCNPEYEVFCGYDGEDIKNNERNII